MARRNPQQGRSFRDQEQYGYPGYRGPQGRMDYERYDRENPYYREGEGLHVAHIEEMQSRGRSAQQRFRENIRGREDYRGDRNFDEGSTGMAYYPNMAFRGLRDRYDSAPRFFDRFDYDDRTSGGFTGSFIGRGPKGYRRSDDRIREDVCEALTFDPFVDASEIEVVVLDGNVTLNGSVDDRTQKRRAEEAAENVSGVRDINNQIRPNYSGERGTTGQQTGSQISQQGGKESKRAA